MARSAGTSHFRKTKSQSTDGDRTTRNWYLFPNYERRSGSSSRTIWRRKNSRSAPNCQVGRCRLSRLRWLWGTREWNDRCFKWISRINWSNNWWVFDESDDFNCEYVKYAGSGTGSLDLYRDYHCRIFPWYGLLSRNYGGFYFSLGRSVTRNEWPVRRNAWWWRLSSLFR